LFLQLQPSFDPKIKMVDLQDLVACGTIFKQGSIVQFYYTQESELKDANHGERSKVCIAQM
jgi:hypothetical protein